MLNNLYYNSRFLKTSEICALYNMQYIFYHMDRHIIPVQIRYLGIWVIHIVEIKLLMLLSDRLLMTS
jgi:hypothetical protein